MQLLLRSGGQQMAIDIERAPEQTLMVGDYRYNTAQLARKVRRLATAMWGAALVPGILEQRLTFEALDGGRASGLWNDSGSFSPNSGSYVILGRWDEDGTVGIALHELAHEMHMRAGGYDDSDGVVREAMAVLAERESGLQRTFEREPYYTAANLIGQLAELSAFRKQPFAKRWEEVSAVTSDIALADLVNYYLDRSERLGLARWLTRHNADADIRDALMSRLAGTSLRYSMHLRRAIIQNVVRCAPTMASEQLAYVLDSISTLDRRYPNDDLEQIITFCFAPHQRQRKSLFAFAVGS
jgi:hypothetical protein